ncbi:MAG: transposase, partial [Verrucomicrobiota bacterium JB023]|nr:transposase [Verrucomicrobiota bacterium JB023]
MTSAIARSLSRFSCAANSFSASQLTAEQWTALPETLTVRYIKMGYENRSGEKKMLVVVTDLLDATKYPGEELIDLYARRWEIEVKLRDLKPPLGFEFIRAQSPAMARKTLLMTLIAYNLIRALMQSAAAEAGIPVRELSFKGVLDQIISSRDHFKTLYERPAARRKHRSALITLCATKRLNIRPFRHEPRA